MRPKTEYEKQVDALIEKEYGPEGLQGELVKMIAGGICLLLVIAGLLIVWLFG